MSYDFSTTPEQAIEAERHSAVRWAVGNLTSRTYPHREWRIADTLAVLARSVERQARIAGCGDVVIPTGEAA